ncbi:hypothetical protein [Polynucleobacter ibericus]|uniref:hypothetical protein n=1 Tax=Polynucleobacter ibericus TaxID=1819725 RepID=UPI001BFE828E|nr:hypothetical protein [Polynucleobacter ibericus]QWE08970.1 SGNH/GDSL hydrolase family protein [Polynucleobacter ibericus]
MKKYKQITILIFSVLLAWLLLSLYNDRRIQADDFALGKENTSRIEILDGVQFTAHNVEEINSVINYYGNVYGAKVSHQARPKIVLWLGNSQIHTINQFKSGEHIAPYWLRKFNGCEECILPLGISLSNANPQEELLLSQFVESKLNLDALVVEVEFMGFREGGLRKELSQIVNANLVDVLRDSSVSKELEQLFDGDRGVEGDVIDSRTDGSAKQRIENFLSESLGDLWKLWKDRGNLRSAFLGDLFNLRNWIFNISSASQRKIIKPRYEKNVKALEDLLTYSKASKIPVILYIAPVRQDKPLPYDQREYSQWKEQVQQLAKVYSATYLNYENLVPGEDWGSNFGEDIDFMHFQGGGHKIVAKEILSTLQSRLK